MRSSRRRTSKLRIRIEKQERLNLGSKSRDDCGDQNSLFVQGHRNPLLVAAQPIGFLPSRLKAYRLNAGFGDSGCVN